MTESLAARCLDPRCLDGPTEDEPMPRYTEADDCLCRRCATLLERRLAEVKAKHDAVVHVMLTALPSRGGSGGNKPTKGAPPVELNLRAHDWITATVGTLVSWTRMVCEERDLRGPDRSEVGLLSTWLLSQLPWLIQHGAVGDLAEEVRDLSKVADGITRANPRRYRLDAPCPLCNARQLTREDGDDHVWCDACGGVWNEDAYPWMVRVALSDSGGFLTAQEAAQRLGVTVGHIRNLVVAGRVRKLGTVDGTARYSTQDVDAVADGAA